MRYSENVTHLPNFWIKLFYHQARELSPNRKELGYRCVVERKDMVNIYMNLSWFLVLSIRKRKGG